MLGVGSKVKRKTFVRDQIGVGVIIDHDKWNAVVSFDDGSCTVIALSVPLTELEEVVYDVLQ